MSGELLPDNCKQCGATLRGGATRHSKDCPLYPLSYWALTNDPAVRAELEKKTHEPTEH